MEPLWPNKIGQSTGLPGEWGPLHLTGQFAETMPLLVSQTSSWTAISAQPKPLSNFSQTLQPPQLSLKLGVLNLSALPWFGRSPF